MSCLSRGSVRWCSTPRPQRMPPTSTRSACSRTGRQFRPRRRSRTSCSRGRVISDAEGFLDPRAIVLDQFEELFTAHPDRWPQRQPFLEQLTEALSDDPLLRVVLAIREDYIAQLEGYAGAIPEGLRHRYRLDRLARDAALSAITAPLEPTARSFAPGVAEKLVDDLLTFRVDRGDGTSAKVPGEFVEPVQLQVVCERLWAGLPPDATEITEEHLRAFGDVDDMLRHLYAEAVQNAASRSGVPRGAAAAVDSGAADHTGREARHRLPCGVLHRRAFERRYRRARARSCDAGRVARGSALVRADARSPDRAGPDVECRVLRRGDGFEDGAA